MKLKLSKTQINMNISKISIQNFRSVEKIENLNINKFNVFVGQNNHGKTNLFEAIEWFFGLNGNLEDIKFMQNPDNEVLVEIEFVGLQNALELFTNEKQKKFVSEMFNGADKISIRRYSAYEKGEDRQLFNPSSNSWQNPLGRDTTWRQFLPTFEYVSTKKFLEDVAKYGKTTPISKMLSAVLEKMLESDPVYSDFKKTFTELFGDPSDPTKKTQVRKSIDDIGGSVAAFLHKQFPDCTDVKFKVENPELEDLFKKFRTTVNDGIENDSSEKGDGMQRALMLAIIQAYSEFRKNNGESKNFIFLIDEAELHLHPTAQRALKNALLDIAKTSDQVLVNTHSSVLVADDDEIQTIFKVEKQNKITSVLPIDEKRKQLVVYELLGGSPADLLLPRNFLIVEGVSERALLTDVTNRFYQDKPIIQIISACGDLDKQQNSMDAINTAYIPLGVTSPVYKERLIILCDKPKTTVKENDKNSFLNSNAHLKNNGQYFELPTDALEKYYPDQWKKDESEIKKLDDTPNGKLLLARDVVGKNITKSQFETDMKVMFEALKKCWELAYQ